VIGNNDRRSAIGGVHALNGSPWSIELPDGGDEADTVQWDGAAGFALRWPGGAVDRALRVLRVGPGGAVLADSVFGRDPQESVIGMQPGASDRVWVHSRRSAIGGTIPLRRVELDGAANLVRDETLDLPFTVGREPFIVAMPFGRWLVVSPAEEAGRIDVRLIEGQGPPVWQRLIDAPADSTLAVRTADSTTWLAFGSPGFETIRLQAIDGDGLVGPISRALAYAFDGRIDCDPDYCIVVVRPADQASGCRIVASVIARDGGKRSSGERVASARCRVVAATRDFDFAWVAWTLLSPGTVQAAVVSPITSVSLSDGFE
jgi:hypothetical protein